MTAPVTPDSAEFSPDEEARFRAMMEASFEGIAIHDKGRILDANPAFAAILGYDFAEIRSKPLVELVDEASREKLMQQVRSGSTEPYEVTAVRKDGSTIDVEVRGKDVVLGGERRRVAAVRDVTLYKRTQRVLEERVEERTRELARKQQLLDERNQQVTRQLELARRVQQSILPAGSMTFGAVTLQALYEPAMEVGGDVYQTIMLGDGTFAVLVADVTGHGVGAALSTVLVSSAFSGHLGQQATATDILASMNDVLARSMPGGAYLAAVVAIVNADDGTCEVANAGLTAPLVARAESGDVETVECNNPLLAMLEDGYVASESRTVELARGDTLWLQTDGLAEVRNEAGEFFAEPLAALLSADRGRSLDTILQAAYGAARRFARPEFGWDDITVLGLRRGR